MVEATLSDDEQRLAGGNVGGAVLVGGTVRRPTGAVDGATPAPGRRLDG